MDTNAVILQNSGKFYNKNGQQSDLSTIWNYPIRGHLWKINQAAFCSKTGDFVTVDERGQIYLFSLKENSYNLIKKAAAPVIAIAFSPSKSRQLIIAYENGAVLLLDIDTKSVVANVPHLTSAFEKNGPPMSISCHLKTSTTAVAYQSSLTLWNLQTMSCISTLELAHPLLGCEFIDVSRSQQYIAVVFVSGSSSNFSGTVQNSKARSVAPIAVFYDCKTFEASTECHFPTYERVPTHFTAYCIVDYTPMNASIHHKSTAATPAPIAHTNRYLVMSGANGSLYIWEVILKEGSVSQSSSTGQSSRCVYLGAVDLPVKIQYTVAMQQLGDRDCSPRLGLLSATGQFIIVDIEGICSGSVGYWTVVSELGAEKMIGKFQNPVEDPGKSQLPCALYHRTKDKLVAYKEFVLVIGVDGAVRVFNSQLLIGDSVASPSSSKNIVGRRLVVREKNHTPGAESESDDEPDVTVEIKEFKVHGGVLTSTSSLEQAKKEKEKARKIRVQQAKLLATHVAKSDSFTSNSGGVVDDVNEDKLSEVSSENNSNPNAKSSKRVHITNAHSAKLKAAKAAQEEELTLPLFELAYIMPKERAVNEEKLKAFLKRNGSYPEKYRPLIWRFLLKLPENQAIFSDLARRGTHSSYDDLYSRFPLQNSRQFSRLQATCSMVTHWAEIFGELPYLPVVVFPFLLVFNRDDLAVLETVITLFMWWGYSWQVTFPNPPVHIVNAIDSLLKLHDAKLHFHMSGLNSLNTNPMHASAVRNAATNVPGLHKSKSTPVEMAKPQGLSPGLVGWLLMSTLFTEMLSKESWLQLMDHIFTHPDKIALMLLAPVAIMRTTRTEILQTTNLKAANVFYRRQQHVDVTQVVACMYSMLKSTPAKFLVALHIPVTTNSNSHTMDSISSTADGAPKLKASRMHKNDFESKDSGGFVGVDSIRETVGDVAVSEGSPAFPLPKCSSNYPAYDGFPKTLIDYQLMNRERTMELHNESVERKKILRQLEVKIAAVETEHQRWMSKHKSVSQGELEHRKLMMAKEKAHLIELRGIEEEISKQRIKSLSVLEEVAKEELELIDKVADESRRLMQQGEAHMNEKMAITVNVQQHRELAVKAEQTSMQHMRQLMMHRTREDWVHGLDSVFKAKESELEAKNAILAEEWRLQDEATRAKQQQREEQLRREAQQEKFGELQGEMTERLQKLYLARQAKIMEVERSRAMRLAKEHADEAIEVSDRSCLLLQKQELATAAEEDAIFSERSIQQAQDRLLSSIDAIKDEGEKLVEAERIYAVKQQQARQRARVAQLRKEWAEKQGKQLQKTVEAERYAQEQIIRMRKATARVGAEVMQPLPVSLTASSGNTNDAVSADMRDYYTNAEGRLQDIADKLIRDQTRKDDGADNLSAGGSSNTVGTTGRSTSGGAATGSGSRAGHVSEERGNDMREYYTGAEGRLQDISDKLVQEKNRRYREIKASQSPYRVLEADDEDSESVEKLSAQSATLDKALRDANLSGSGTSTSASRPSKMQTEAKEFLMQHQRTGSGSRKQRHPTSDSSSSAEDVAMEAVRVSAPRSKGVILQSSDSDSDGSAAAREVIASKRIAQSHRSTASAAVSSDKKLNVNAKQLSDIADGAASYLEQFDSVMSNSSSSAIGRNTSTSRTTVTTTNIASSGAPRSRRTINTGNKYQDGVLERVTNESLRSLQELQDELRQEESEDRNISRDSMNYTHTSIHSTSQRDSRSTAINRGLHDYDSSEDDVSYTAPSGLDEDSTLWNIQGESSEEH